MSFKNHSFPPPINIGERIDKEEVSSLAREGGEMEKLLLLFLRIRKFWVLAAAGSPS